MNLKNKPWALYILFGAIFTVIWGVWFDYSYWQWLICWALTTGASLAAAHLIKYQYLTLDKRITSEKTTEWDVYINNIRMGTVTDAQYASMQQRVYIDPKNSMAQIVNIVYVLQTVIIKLAVAIPLGVFWMMVFSLGYSPDTWVGTIQLLQTADAASLTAAAKSLHEMFFMLALLTALIAGVMMALGVKFGFKNVYADAIGVLLRQHFKVPADGEIRLCRPVHFDTIHEHGKSAP
ncbi:hypothetical protein [Methylomonas rosea]|uniref:Uncharacterized protein n=1 Tax=Methylomonas rosea TaxID=2952227 RepID=A0ABT1TWN2_9GAMM|nr:hypothetical protein [Methylomonas sp. WSC-7]MCQ8118488.1 hypothetical protein [Methylomonas sp. WSC-7]PPD24646.1 MAG: hypothetical protein CTY24_00225 [Methylobacter sp.]